MGENEGVTQARMTMAPLEGWCLRLEGPDWSMWSGVYDSAEKAEKQAEKVNKKGAMKASVARWQDAT